MVKLKKYFIPAFFAVAIFHALFSLWLTVLLSHETDIGVDIDVSHHINTNVPRLCQQTYFWGGGKAGSTSLYFTLVGGPGKPSNAENNGPFVNFYKEPCSGTEWQQWVSMMQNTTLCGQTTKTGVQRTHILNGCPRNTGISYARKISKINAGIANSTAQPTFLFLVRDPVDRITSLLNDSVRRGGSKIDIEQAAANAAKNNPLRIHMRNLFYQGEALKNLLSVVQKEQILVIPMESMSTDPQGVVNAVMDHIGGDRLDLPHTSKSKVDMKMNVGDNPTSTYKYIKLSNKTTQALRDKLREDVLLLEKLVGKRFVWSSWARDNEGDVMNTSWLTTTPV